MLTWETEPFEMALEFAGAVELALEATITALDTSWIAVLYGVSPTGKSEAITAGWLRASFSDVDETQSMPGSPFLPCVKPVAIRPNMLTTYRIPLVDNARHLPNGHRLRLVLASSDEAEKFPTVLGFTHTVVREASLNAISSASRLWLPVLPPRHPNRNL
jgi:predicted acyl esterase